MTHILYNCRDSFTLFKRCSLISLRNPDIVVTTVMLPVMMMLTFVFLFGGAMQVGNVAYVNYVVPGVMILSIGNCAASTAVSVHLDLSKGIVDRFRSMSIAKSSVLAGHVLSSVARNYFSTTLVVLVALAIGFRPNAHLAYWLLAALLVLIYMLVVTWLSVFFGLLAKSPDGAGAIGVFILFFPYLSSGFVPTETMPVYLRVFSEYQPLTPVIEALRSLLMGDPPSILYAHLLAAVAWCGGLLVLFYGLSLWLFSKKTS